MRPAKTQISLGIRPVWSESLLCTQWVAMGPMFLYANSEDSDQIGRMPRLIWVFAGRTCHFVGFDLRWLICSWTDWLTDLFRFLGTQLVYIIRDPRAVAVSWFYHLSKLSPPANFNGNWKDFSYFFNNGLGEWKHKILEVLHSVNSCSAFSW